VSCSPFRVPVARLAAARAALKHGGAGQAGRLTAETVPPARQRRSSAEETLAQAIAVGESAG
jgi:hypothetical protein